MQSFLVKHQITQVTQPPYNLKFGALQFLAFPQTKITFEREEISNHQWDSGKCDGPADGDWENCVRSQDVYFEGEWGVIVLCTISLVPCIIFNKCVYFSFYMVGYFLNRPVFLNCISTQLVNNKENISGEEKKLIHLNVQTALKTLYYNSSTKMILRVFAIRHKVL